MSFCHSYALLLNANGSSVRKLPKVFYNCRVSGAGSRVTELLAAWQGGNRDALNLLMPIVMTELKRIARAYLAREARDPMLQTTALVNEAYLRLVDVQVNQWECRVQFFALSAQIMRRILVDHARARLGPQRGGRSPHVPLDPDLVVALDPAPGLIALDEALLSLEKLDQRKSRVAEMRVFGGLTNDEAAHVLGISPRTVIREWKFAKAWLARELNYDRGG